MGKKEIQRRGGRVEEGSDRLAETPKPSITPKCVIRAAWLQGGGLRGEGEREGEAQRRKRRTIRERKSVREEGNRVKEWGRGGARRGVYAQGRTGGTGGELVWSDKGRLVRFREMWIFNRLGRGVSGRGGAEASGGKEESLSVITSVSDGIAKE